MTFDELAATLDYNDMATVPLESTPDGGCLPAGLILRQEGISTHLNPPKPWVSYYLIGDERTYAAETYEDGTRTTWEEALKGEHKDARYTGWAWVNPQLGLKPQWLAAGAAVDRRSDPR